MHPWNRLNSGLEDLRYESWLSLPIPECPKIWDPERKNGTKRHWKSISNLKKNGSLQEIALKSQKNVILRAYCEWRSRKN